MATLRNIKRRIVSVRSTQQITKAMKMVAAAKLRKAQGRLLSARPYAREMEEVLRQVSLRLRKKKHPLLEIRKGNKVLYVLVTADRGLCGGFNSNLIRRCQSEWTQNPAEAKHLMTVGRKGYEFFRRREFKIESHVVDLFNNLEFHHAQLITAKVIELYSAKKVDRVMVIYNEFKSAVQQKIIVEQLLPIQPAQPVDAKRYPVGFLFEPSPMKILDNLVPLNLNTQMWRILLESNASEFGARMTAMESASDNAEDMIKELVLFYNKARQANITNELNEIVTGANALRG
jgi:F-type H+-transporting ATPase subunit gamma